MDIDIIDINSANLGEEEELLRSAEGVEMKYAGFNPLLIYEDGLELLDVMSIDIQTDGVLISEQPDEVTSYRLTKEEFLRFIIECVKVYHKL